jgi:hypothetical protein
MPKYLTISSDLQLIPGEGSRFVSRSGKALVVVEAEVRRWLGKNEAHPMGSLVEAWLDGVDLNQHRRKRKQEETYQTILKELEKSVRRFLTSAYRRKGWSLDKARQEAAKRAINAATKLLE